MGVAGNDVLHARSRPWERLEDVRGLIGVYRGPGVAAERQRDELLHLAGSGFLADEAGPIGYVLLPSGDDEDVLRRAGELHRRLSAPSWVAVTRRPNAELQAGKREVCEVTAVAVASGSPPGLYRVTDLPVECAVVRQPVVRRRLVDLISPIVDQPLLRAAVESLVAADGNRSKAAAEIGVHHSTLGYRQRRIRELTGMDPMSARDLATLSIAITLHTAVHGDILRAIPPGEESS